jgi:hypothetical protein
MNTHADKTQGNKSQSVALASPQMQSSDEATLQYVDNRPEAFAQKKLQETANNSRSPMQLKVFHGIANNSLQTDQTAQLQAMADDYYAQQKQPIQKKANNTGLPDNLKSGIENLSGYSMDDVKVHYNSDKPAQLQAHAYAQGTDVHLASGQEKHLPHEAWHVVQQKQGRVKPTMHMKGKVNVNDDVGLEKEADRMGEKAVTNTMVQHKKLTTQSLIDSPSIQRKVGVEIETEIPVHKYAAGEYAKMESYYSKNLAGMQGFVVGKTWDTDEIHDSDKLAIFKKRGDSNYDSSFHKLSEPVGDAITPLEIAQHKLKYTTFRDEMIADLNALYTDFSTAAMEAPMNAEVPTLYNGTWVQVKVDHNNKVGFSGFENYPKKGIIEIVTKPVNDDAEADLAKAEWDLLMASMGDMKEKTQVAALNNVYVGPAVKRTSALLSLGSAMGNIQVNMGIPVSAVPKAIDALFNEGTGIVKPKFPDGSLGAKQANLMNGVGARATAVVGDVVWSGTTVLTEAEKKEVTGLISVLLMYIDLGTLTDNVGNAKNAWPLLPKTSLFQFYTNLSVNAKAQWDASKDSIWAKILLKTGKGEGDQLILNTTNDTDDADWTVSDVKECLVKATSGPIVASGTSEVDVHPLVTGEATTGGVFEFRSIQDLKIPRAQWLNVIKDYLKLSSSLAKEEDVSTKVYSTDATSVTGPGY